MTKHMTIEKINPQILLFAVFVIVTLIILAPFVPAKYFSLIDPIIITFVGFACIYSSVIGYHFISPGILRSDYWKGKFFVLRAGKLLRILLFIFGSAIIIFGINMFIEEFGQL